MPVTQKSLDLPACSLYPMHRIPSQFSKGLTGQKFITCFKEREGQVIIDEGNQKKKESMCLFDLWKSSLCSRDTA